MVYEDKIVIESDERIVSTSIDKIEVFDKGTDTTTVIDTSKHLYCPYCYPDEESYGLSNKFLESKIDSLLNQKQNLIENNIKLINIINQIKSNKGNKQNMKLNKENEDLKILKDKNIKLKDALHKYDNIIKNLNLSIKNKSNNSKSENGIDQKLFEANKYNDKIKNGIENTINKYKNEISQKNLLINKLTNKYISLKKNDLSSVDKIII